MSGSCNLMETAKSPVVYSVKDTLKATTYYFIQPLNDKLDKLFGDLTKSNSKAKSLSVKDKEMLVDFYPFDPNLASSFELNAKSNNLFQIVPFFLFKTDSILDVKRKLMLATNYYYNDIHLWVDTHIVDNNTSKKLAKRYGITCEPPNTFTKMRYLEEYDFLDVKTKLSLGLEYEGTGGIELLNPNPAKISDEIPAVAIIDSSTRTLGSYNIKKNEISMMDFYTYREKHPSETEKNLQILRLFFPKSNEETEFRDENTGEIRRITEKLVSLSKVPLEKEETLVKIGEDDIEINKNIGFNNLVIQVNRPANVYKKVSGERDINLLEIFEKMTLSANIPYVRYRDIDRKYFTRNSIT